MDKGDMACDLYGLRTREMSVVVEGELCALLFCLFLFFVDSIEPLLPCFEFTFPSPEVVWSREDLLCVVDLVWWKKKSKKRHRREKDRNEKCCA